MSENAGTTKVGLNATSFKGLCFDVNCFNIPDSFRVLEGKPFDVKNDDGVVTGHGTSVTVVDDSVFSALANIPNMTLDTVKPTSIRVKVQSPSDLKALSFGYGERDNYDNLTIGTGGATIQFVGLKIEPAWEQGQGNRSGQYRGLKFEADGIKVLKKATKGAYDSETKGLQL